MSGRLGRLLNHRIGPNGLPIWPLMLMGVSIVLLGGGVLDAPEPVPGWVGLGAFYAGALALTAALIALVVLTERGIRRPTRWRVVGVSARSAPDRSAIGVYQWPRAHRGVRLAGLSLLALGAVTLVARLWSEFGQGERWPVGWGLGISWVMFGILLWRSSEARAAMSVDGMQVYDGFITNRYSWAKITRVEVNELSNRPVRLRLSNGKAMPLPGVPVTDAVTIAQRVSDERP